MCGIAALLVASGFSATDAWIQSLQAILSARGPDHSGYKRVSLGASVEPQEDIEAHLLGSVLHLRGDILRPQPAADAYGNILLWNGEVFVSKGFEVLPHQSDTEAVLQQLGAAPAASVDEPFAHHLRDVLSRIEGPYAFIYYHAATHSLFYGRDPLGRRGLLTGKSRAAGKAFVISSVACGAADLSSDLVWREVDVRGFYCRRTGRDDGDGDELIPWHPWQVSFSSHAASITPEIPSDLRKGVAAAAANTDKKGDELAAARGLLEVLDGAVGRRVASIQRPPRTSGQAGVSDGADDEQEEGDGCGGDARVAVLFSGGLDSMVVACLAHRHVPPQEPIDLVNVCFDQDNASPDRLGAIKGRQELQARHPDRLWRLILVDLGYDQVKQYEDRIKQLIQPCGTPMDFNISCAFWFAARGRGRVLALDAADDDHDDDQGHHLPGDDARHVAQARIGGPRVHKSALLRYGSGQRLDGGGGGNEEEDEETEGQVARLNSHQEQGEGAQGANGLMMCPQPRCRRAQKRGCAFGLCRYCCIRRQKEQGEGGAEERLCRVHKTGRRSRPPVERAEKERDGDDDDDAPVADEGGVTSSSSAPATAEQAANEQDEACHDGAASVVPSGEMIEPGSTCASPSKRSSSHCYIRSRARVLLLGVGADEQMGGYGRHRAAYQRRGMTGLRDELALDMGRMWTRNLGRDDRCVSDHGRESRLPFLDEQVVAYLQALPLHLKCDMREPMGVGDKKVLRQVAGQLLGLPSCARLVKRAIQFGSRIAREANIHHFGSHRAGKGDRWKKTGGWKATGGSEDGMDHDDDDDDGGGNDDDNDGGDQAV